MKIFSKLVALATCSLFFSTASFATGTVFGEVQADAGDYSPIALGESLTLDACGSEFITTDTSTAYGLCNGVTDINQFAFSWALFRGPMLFMGYISVPGSPGTRSTSPIVTLTTGGVGDLIQTVGSYFLVLNVTFSPVSNTFALPGGLTGGFLPIASGTDRPNSHSERISFVVTSVPEPAAALLLAPALLMVARRQRRRRKDA